MEQENVGADFQRELSESIAQTLLREARRNELTVSYVRAIALSFAAALDYLLYVQPLGLILPYEFSITNFYLAAFWLVVAVAIAVTLRRGWYRPWLRIGLPLLDGAIVYSLILNIFLTAAEVEYILPSIISMAVACSLLAVSGSLRLTREAVWLTTGLAIASYSSSAALVDLPLPQTIFTCALLTGIGFFSMWMSDIVRRSVESEVGRLILARFLPEEVVEGAHRHPLSMITQPRRLEVTLLVSDLRNFTAYAEGLAPEVVLARLNAIQGTLAETVRAHGGWVDKFMGDGMLAVFGMSPDSIDHARRGIAAAAAMIAAIEDLAVREGAPIRLGVGVHSGPIVAGCLGKGLRLEFTVIGDTVNIASRLESLTKEMGVGVLVSDEARVQAASGEEALPKLEPLGEVSIRGRQMPLQVFTVAA